METRLKLVNDYIDYSIHVMYNVNQTLFNSVQHGTNTDCVMTSDVDMYICILYTLQSDSLQIQLVFIIDNI